MEELTPRVIVRELDKHIVGQTEAKRAVAVAVRNRLRRQSVPQEMQEDIIPKNILLMGPTGVGKTEICRRLAKLVNAPFVKVEASKFTEVGYVGRDVDSIIRDLVENAVSTTKKENLEQVLEKAGILAEERLLDILCPLPRKEKTQRNPFEMLFGTGKEQQEKTEQQESEEYLGNLQRVQVERREIRERLRTGALDEQEVEIEVEYAPSQRLEFFDGFNVQEMELDMENLFGGLLPKQTKKKKVTVEEARRILIQEEADKLIDEDEVVAEALERCEQLGIVFLDELDKIAGRETGMGPDVSREGVQRDLLPIVEGTTIITKYGPVKTDHILFIGAGAFHVSKPSDMIPELQGRFPIRVELDPLEEQDFVRILTEPENSLTRQYKELLATDGVELEFTDDGIQEIAKMAFMVNQQDENIGARRLHTVMEKVLEDVLFDAPDGIQGNVTVNKEYVSAKIGDLVRDRDLTRYIL
ncbi:MAG: ATP-dependent protease ATPase subunit HslU [Firmicutes bacterium]|nr:ATP-dependent protease ATPase subunit HslU [Candidatus Fermentithermobacillaceae bacterium]